MVKHFLGVQMVLGGRAQSDLLSVTVARVGCELGLVDGNSDGIMNGLAVGECSVGATTVAVDILTWDHQVPPSRVCQMISVI